jgi:large subunit ribosomal protein L14e
LTKWVLKIQHGARAGTLRRAWEKSGVDQKWAESNWAKRLAARKLRAQNTDFDRFKLMRAKQAVNNSIFLFFILKT